MAGKIKSMSQVKQLLQMHRNGCSKKEIARTVGLSKNTVKSYLIKLEKMPLSIAELLALEDPVLEARFHAGNPSYKEAARYEELKQQFDYYEKELKRQGVTRQLLWEEYKEKHPDGYGYSQFCFHLLQQMKSKKTYMVLEHKPGDKLYIDFAGLKINYTDRETGELIGCPVLVACLPFSDYAFAMALPSQNLEDFLHGLTCCLNAMGGVPQAIVPDNMKTAVIKADRYEPTINRALEDFANHYQTVIYPTRVRKPRDKALVENQVRLIYTRVFARLRNHTFFDLISLNEAIAEMIKKHNQTRMQRKPFCREENFLANEQQLLSPLPTEPYELRHYTELTAAANNHVYLRRDDRYYSYPHVYRGEKLKVIYTRSILKLFFKGTQIAAHSRLGSSRYETNESHLCSTYKSYKDRSPQYYIDQGYMRSMILGKYIEEFFNQGGYPEIKYRSCDGLFRLFRETDLSVFEEACQIGIDNRQFSYKFLLRVIQNNMTGQTKSMPIKPLPKHPNIRGRQYYNQTSLNL